MASTTETTGAPGAPPRTAQGPSDDGTFSHRQIVTIIGGLMLGMFLASLDQTVVSTAIRTIADDLQGYDLQAWATTAFLITSTISTPLYGKLSDLYGRKPLYLAAIAIFVVGSVLCTFATSMYGLAVFRAVQGLGAGGLLSLAFAILGDIVAPRERSRYQAYFMAVFGSSSVIGPVVGGVFSGADSILGIDGWRWIFLVNVPLGIAALVVVNRVLHIPHTRRDQRVDWPGAIALTVFLVPLLVVAEQGRTWGWASPEALVSYAVGAAGFVVFVVVESRYRDSALLPLRMFRERTFSVGVTASLIVGVGMFGGLLLLPQYLQVVKGSSPTVAGFQMLPLVLGIMTAAAISGVLISRTGRYKVFPIVGTALMALVLLALSQITATTGYWTIAPLMLAMGLGLGLNMQPVILAVQNASAPRDMGVATSSVTFFRQIGGTLGVAVFLSVLFSVLGGRVRSAYAEAAGTPAFAAALAADPAQAERLASGTSGGLASTEFLTGLDPVVASPFLEAFSDSIGTVFLIAAAAMAVAFVTTLFLPELPLRTTSGVQAQAQDDAQARAQVRSAAGGPTTDTAAATVAAGHSAPTSTAPTGGTRRV